MEGFMSTVIQNLSLKRIERTRKNLEKNNISTHLAKTSSELMEIIESLVSPNSSVSVGGSMSLFESDVLSHLRSGRYHFLDRYQEGLTPEDIQNLYIRSFGVDAYFASSNAVTEDGLLYNVDGNGNRVAAITYGPKKVILIVGVNKIVKDLPEAIARNKSISAPANAMRLNTETPCKTTGKCEECKSPSRICCTYTVHGFQRIANRIHVIFLNENLGY